MANVTVQRSYHAGVSILHGGGLSSDIPKSDYVIYG